MADLLNGPAITGPRYPSYDTPAGSTVDLDQTETQITYRDELLLGVYQLLSGCHLPTSKEIDDAIRTAAEVIRKVDRHCNGAE